MQTPDESSGIFEEIFRVTILAQLFGKEDFAFLMSGSPTSLQTVASNARRNDRSKILRFLRFCYSLISLSTLSIIQ